LDDITVKDLALYRLKVAEERLNAAQILFERRMYADTVSRAYYAIFQAARAALALKRLDSRKHSGIISLFNQQFVKTNILPKDHGKILKRTRDLREASDYDDFYLVSREEAQVAIEDACKFISDLTLLIKNFKEY
jgi:uncharacterized protein (UPF0332 family)